MFGLGARVERGRQQLLVDGHHRLEQAGRAAPALRWPMLLLAEPRAMLPRGAAKDLGQALDLDHIADLGAGAVRLDQRRRGRVEAGVFPGPPRGQHLADRIRRSDALALAVGETAHAADDGVNLVAIPFGVGQALEQEEAPTLAHDKAIGAIAKRTAAGGAERPDLAELDEDGRPHVAVNAAGDHGVAMVLGQHFDGGIDGGKTGRTGRVGDEVRPAQVQHIGHTDPTRYWAVRPASCLRSSAADRLSARSCHCARMASRTAAGSC